MKIHAASLALYGAVAFITLNSCAALAGTGHAVHYHDKYQGRKTANGEVFDQNKLTAAHNQLPYGSKVKVTNLSNDRMAQHNRNIIDVTKHAAKRLGFFGKGRARVILERIQ